MSNAALLDLFDGLRLADLRDGMDALGYLHVGSMDAGIRPLFRTVAIGVARTARYLPYQGVQPPSDPSEYAKWSGWYYGTVCLYPWADKIEPGDFMAIDASGVDAGLIGSENSLAFLRRGMVGLVTGGGIRDTDEVILQQVPCWARHVSKSMVQGRLQFDAMDVPVCIGGQTVHPGDVIAADGDGVLVIPSGIARDVARLAREENERDRAARRRHYEALGRSPDDTV